MQTDTGRPDEGFDSVFARDDVEDSHDSGAEPVAPEAAQPRDEAGRFTSVHNQPVDEPQQAEPAQPEPPPQASQPETPPQQQPRLIPLPELQSERQKRQEAERQLAALQGQMQAFQQMYQRPPQQAQPQQEAMPDPYADPEGWARFQQTQIQRQQEAMQLQVRDQIANMSEVWARRQFGDDLVQKAQQWAIQTGAAQHFFLNARDPYGELIDAYKRQEALTRIGSDVDSYEKRIREEERQKVLAELKAGGGQPRPTFPGTLANGTPTGRQGGHLDPQTAADSVFARPGG